MNGKFFIYFYYDNTDTLMYIGKAIDVWERWNSHQERWKKDVCKIGVYKCNDHAAMDILESYFIATTPTLYNTAGLYHGYTSLEIPNLKEPIIYSLDEFKAKFHHTTGKRKRPEQLPPLDTQLRELGNTIVEIDGFVDLYDEKLLQMDLDRVCFKYKNMYLISRFSARPGIRITKKEQQLSHRTNEVIQITKKYLNSPAFTTRTEEGRVHFCSEFEARSRDEAVRILDLLLGYCIFYELFEIENYFRGERLSRVGSSRPQAAGFGGKCAAYLKESTNIWSFDLTFRKEEHLGEQPIISSNSFSYDIEKLYSEIMENNNRRF